MPYTKKPRPYQKEYSQQVDRGEHEARMERQRARRKLDKEGVARKGKFEGIRRQTMVYEQKYNTGKMCGNRLRQKSGIKIEAVSKAKTVSFYMFFL